MEEQPSNSQTDMWFELAKEAGLVDWRQKQLQQELGALGASPELSAVFSQLLVVNEVKMWEACYTAVAQAWAALNPEGAGAFPSPAQVMETAKQWYLGGESDAGTLE